MDEVELAEGPTLILAGAGTGKTRALVNRMAHILGTHRAAAYQVFAVTFTNKAAGEMRSRLVELVGERAHEAWIGTFHSLCARLLRREAGALGYSERFSILGPAESTRLLRNVMREVRGLAVSAEPLAEEIERAKNAGLSALAYEEAVAADDHPLRRDTARVFPRYQAALRRANAMDLGDLVLNVVELLRADPRGPDSLARRFRYVLVDEFQDTNAVQFELVRRLAGIHRNLTVVGDDDQSIYGWRGADVAHILEFERSFPDAALVRLEQNFRSTGNILAAANAVIRHNTNRREKTLWTDAPAGAPVRIVEAQSAEHEAELVAGEIARRVEEGEAPERFAVLYRTNAQSRPFEFALRRRGVPFVVVGGPGFYDGEEVRDVLAYLRLVADPASRRDFERIVNRPRRGLQPTAVARLLDLGARRGLQGAEVLEAPGLWADVGLRAEPLVALRDLLERARALAQTASATEVAQLVVEGTGYLDHLRRGDPTRVDERVASVVELVAAIADHDASGPEDDDRAPLQVFLSNVALLESGECAGAGVSLLTLHAAKGLEFPVVFMVGMEEGTFPLEGANIEEERRLCYVGMTRAREALQCSWSSARTLSPFAIEGRGATGNRAFDGWLVTREGAHCPPDEC